MNDTALMTATKPKFSLFRKIFSFPAMLCLFLAAVVWMLASGKVNDPDIWWHLRNAEYLLQTHHFPNQDMYSFTVAGRSWMNYEWVSEVPYYLAWRAGGLAGVTMLWVLVVEVIFLGLLYRSYRATRNIKASVLACAFCTFLAVVSFGPRTILFGYVEMVALLIVLERFREKGRGPLWVLPPLFCLWINTHGSWLIGLIVFGIFAASGLIGEQWGRIESQRWTPSQLRQLILTGAASAGALFINPFGWRLVVYPFEFAAKQKLNVSHIAEWVSVDFHTDRGVVVMILLAGLLMAPLLLKRTWQLSDLGLLLFALYSGLSYIRFLFFVAIIAAPILAKLLDFIPNYEAEIDKPILNVIFMAGTLLWMAHFYTAAPAMDEAVAKEYPAQFLAYAKDHPPAGRVLNEYLWGGYLIWHARDMRVFVDSRVDIYEYAGVFGDYIDLMALKGPEKILDKYQIRYVLFPPGEFLTYALEHDPHWKVNYRDAVCVYFERADGNVDALARSQ